MSLQATCDSCGKTYSLHEKYAGKRLPCKECGELFEVHDEDDFDAPPRRSRGPAGASARRSPPPKRPAAPARSAKKAGGKKRRKSSGPNWLLIGLAGGGGVLALGGLIWALISLTGSSHESLVKKAVAALEELGTVIASVNDVPSAQAAVPRIQKIGDRLASIYEQEQKLKQSKPISLEQDKALREKYEPRLKEAQKRITEEMQRLRDQREVVAILQEPMMDIGKKIMEAQREQFKQRMEENQAKTRARFGPNAP